MIILTGGAGFVGSNLLKRLNADGRSDILIVDSLRCSDKYRNLMGAQFRDLVSKEQFYDRLDRGDWDHEPVEAIFHQGACTDTMEYDGDYMMRMNYAASRSLLEFALRRRVRFIYASSAAVYGHLANAVETPGLEAPLNVYGFSKLAFDNYVRRVALDSESLVVGLRYFNVYGEGEQHKGRMASMVYQLTNQLRDSGVARLFGALGDYGPGEQRRDFVSVHDIVDINLFLLTRDPVQAIVNAGSGTQSTWNQLARHIIDTLGYGIIDYVDFPRDLAPKYQFNTIADLTRLRTLGYTAPMTTLEAGIRAYVSKTGRTAFAVA